MSPDEKALMEKILGGLDLKLNNNYTSFYDRLIMKNEPSLKGFFHTRKISAHVI